MILIKILSLLFSILLINGKVHEEKIQKVQKLIDHLNREEKTILYEKIEKFFENPDKMKLQSKEECKQHRKSCKIKNANKCCSKKCCYGEGCSIDKTNGLNNNTTHKKHGICL